MGKGKRTIWILAGILALAFALRLANIGTEPYWNDEILSLDIVRSFDARTMVRYLSEVEYHPPLYYLVLKAWVGAFGPGEAAVRLLSTVFSLGIVMLAWALGKRFFRSGRVALLAAALTAVLPLQVEYGQEARPYAMIAFLAGLAFWCMYERLEGGPWWWSLGYVLATAAGLYLHYSYVLFAAATGAWWTFGALTRKGGGRMRAFTEAVVVHGAVFLVFYPWLDFLLYKIELGKAVIGGTVSEVPGLRKTIFFEDVLHGMIWPAKNALVTRVEILATFAVKIAAAAAVLAVMAKAGLRKVMKGPVGALTVVSGLTMAFFLMSPQSVGYTDLQERHLLTVLMPLTLVFAWILSKLEKRHAAAFILLLLASLVPSLVAVLDDDSKADRHFRYEDAGEFIAANRQEGDLVIVSVAGIRASLNHYLPEDIPVVALRPLELYGNDAWSGRHVLGVMENDSQIRGIRIVSSERYRAELREQEDGVRRKLSRLIGEYGAERVWYYGFSVSSTDHEWFTEHGWRHAVRSGSDLSRIDLYVAPAPAP